MLLVQLFVYFARVNFCPWSLSLSVRDWLRLVTVTLPGIFYELFVILLKLFIERKKSIPGQKKNKEKEMTVCRPSCRCHGIS